MNILAVDDDPVARSILRRALEELGHAVTLAADGGAAWERFKPAEFQVVISDWMVPELDGLGLCRLIRAGGADSYTYVILLSAKSEQDDRLEGLAAGADDFLTKPLSRPELAARLHVAERILDYQQRLQTLNAELRRHEAIQQRYAGMADAALSDAAKLLAGLRAEQAKIAELEHQRAYAAVPPAA